MRNEVTDDERPGLRGFCHNTSVVGRGSKLGKHSTGDQSRRLVVWGYAGRRAYGTFMSHAILGKVKASRTGVSVAVASKVALAHRWIEVPTDTSHFRSIRRHFCTF